MFQQSVSLAMLVGSRTQGVGGRENRTPEKVGGGGEAGGTRSRKCLDLSLKRGEFTFVLDHRL